LVSNRKDDTVPLGKQQVILRLPVTEKKPALEGGPEANRSAGEAIGTAAEGSGEGGFGLVKGRMEGIRS
jgi:hypothetical protein